MRHLIITVCFAFTAICANAQNIVTLEQCIALGLDRNYSIRIEKNETKISSNNASHGNAGQLPNLSFGSSYDGSIYDNKYFYPDESISTSGTGNNNIYAGLSLDWTIFNGFSLRAEYSRLKELKALGELNLRRTIEDYIADVSAEYYYLIRQIIRLNNLEASVKLSKERLRIVEASYSIGASSGLDYQQAKVDYNADNSDLIAQKELVRSSKIRLCAFMSLEDVEKDLTPADSAITPNTLLDRNELWAATICDNTSLLMAKRNKNISKLELKKVQSRNYPYLKLNAGYGYRKYWYENSTYQSMSQMGLNYGLTAGITIFDGMNRKREQSNAKLSLENQEIAIEQIENNLKSDMATLWMAYSNNLELWEIEKSNLIVANSNFDIAMERYRLRELSGIELREAQISLLNAQERLSSVEYNIKLCEISLQQLSGKLVN